jgi:hypothetical protein
MGSFGTLEQLRSGMQELYSVQVGGGIGVYCFLADSSGQVPFLALATKWLLGDSAREVPLCAEGDAVLYLNNVHPFLKILNINEIPEEERTALARVIVDELIMLFCERWVGDMTEWEQSVYMKLPDDNVSAYMKRAMIMYKGILQPEGYLLTAKDILVLLQGVTAEIQTIKSNTADQPKTPAPAEDQEPTAPAGDQEPKKTGRKEKLSIDIFEREIFPALAKQFPKGQKIRHGIKGVCEEWGRKYGVSESTIRRDFDKLQSGNK